MQKHLKHRFIWGILGIVVLILVVGSIAIYAFSQTVPAEDPVKQDTEDAFPLLKGTNLLMESAELPGNFSGDFNFVGVSYSRDQHNWVKEWLSAIENLAETYPQLESYGTPLLPQSAADASIIILGGLSAEAENDKEREHTIVTFTNVDAFNDIVGITDKKTIQLFILDETGTILWQGSGKYNDEAFSELNTTLANLMPLENTPIAQTEIVEAETPHISSSEAVSFPTLTGTSLLKEEISIPDDLSGELLLLVVSYDKNQQDAVKTWLEGLDNLDDAVTIPEGYNVPLLPEAVNSAADFIIGRMAESATDDTEREHTLVTFTDVDTFNEQTGVSDISVVHPFLITHDGNILWHGVGNYSDEQLNALQTALISASE